MSISMLLISVVLAANVSPKAAERPEKKFSQRVSLRAGEGWTLRELQVDDASSTMLISLTLADKAGKAERLELGWNETTGAFSSYAVRDLARAPMERREYDAQDELFEALQLGPPRGISPGCEDYLMEFAGRSVALDPEGYSVEVATSKGRADAAVATWLMELLEDGELVDVTDERDDNGATVQASVLFVVMSDEGAHTITAALDRRGAVASAELRYRPQAEVFRSYSASAELMQALRRGRRVASMRFAMDSWESPARLELALATGRTTIDFAKFAKLRGADLEQSCGC
jgi:hypothetical protein